MSEQAEQGQVNLAEMAKELGVDIARYMNLQTEELSNTFELVFQLNQAAVGRYDELIHEAAALKTAAKGLQEQEIGVGSFLSNLTVVEYDIARLEQTITKLEHYCTVLEQKLAPA